MVPTMATHLSTLLVSATTAGGGSWSDQFLALAGQLVTGTSVAGVVLVLCVVAASGIALGSLKVKGVSLGIAGVLFTGITMAHLFWNDAAMERWLFPAEPVVTAPATLTAATAPMAGADTPAAVARPANHHREELVEKKKARKEILEFLREFGLILFVYSIGMQVGPGFFGSLRAVGLRWNLLAAGVVLMGVTCAWLAYAVGKVPPAAAVGLLSGAVTNTPGLAAAQQALKDVPGLDAATMAMPSIGYAVAYPFGVLGIILSMITMRLAFRIDPLLESQRFMDTGLMRKSGPANINLAVRNPGVTGKTLDTVLAALAGRVVVSRLSRNGTVHVATSASTLQPEDIIHAVGLKEDLDHLCMMVGEVSQVDLRNASKDLAVKRLLVTRREVVGCTLQDMNLREAYGVNITRINRAGVEFLATPGVDLHYGDTLVAVGDTEGLAAVEKAVGNSIKHLEHPQLIPLFLGIVIGVILGQIPIFLPGLPAPVKLGLAGGPLVAALTFAWMGHLGRISFFIPHSANMMIRELGIVLFLACVGLISGERFVDTLVKGDGLYWMGLAALITVVPLIVMALVGRLVMKLNFMPLCGIMAGSMTDPPALAFANTTAGNELPAIAYATVYPLTMILRILTAQLFVILFAGG